MALHDPIPTIPHVSPVTATVRGPDDRLRAILLKDAPLTADEQAYVDEAERKQIEAERDQMIRRVWASQVRAEMQAIAKQPYRPHALEGSL